MTYRHLTLDERYQLQVLRRQDFKLVEIARMLRRHPSTISRELRRNSRPELRVPYSAPSAQRLVRARRIEKGRRSRKIQGRVQELVEQKLRLSWSPEQIAASWAEEMRRRGVADVFVYGVNLIELRPRQFRGFIRAHMHGSAASVTIEVTVGTDGRAVWLRATARASF